MAALKLAIGNKNYSSWSMRPWLALRANDIPFVETVIPLYTDNPADKDRILSFSRAGKVPVLVDGDITVWDSLSIIEYIAERYPDVKLWPDDVAARAHARSVCAEMHSGFMALRNECGMNLHRPVGAVTLSADARANIARVQEIWRGVPGALRCQGTVPVRPLRCGGCDVRPGRAPFPHLRDRGHAGDQSLHGHDDGAAGVPGMDP
ncbi:glutathione S-transferase [Bradyrhizobium sp. i1.3.1]